MTNITEELTWHPAVYQWADDDPVVGGPPDMNNIPGDGLDNVPIKQLADRTLFLKDNLRGMGGEAIEVADLNAIDRTGVYRAGAGATGHPNPGSDVVTVFHAQGAGGMAWQRAQVTGALAATRYRTDAATAWTAWDRTLAQSSLERAIPGRDIDALFEPGQYHGRGGTGFEPTLGTNPFPASNGYFVVMVERHSAGDLDDYVVQTAKSNSFGDDQILMRQRQAGGWSAWRNIWVGNYAVQQADARIVAASPAIIAANGQQTNPSTLIEKWGIATISADKHTVTFPIAFPTACLHVVVADGTAAAAGPVSVSKFGVEHDTLTAANFKVRAEPGATGTVLWRALGH